MNRLTKFFAALALTILASAGASSGAFAHSDELVTYPEADSTVDGGFIPVELTFAEPLMIMEDGSGHEIAVTDPDGKLVEFQCGIRAGGNTISTAIAANTDGMYSVAWRSVSEDGHPVSGSFEFNVKAVPDFEMPTDTNLMCPQDEPTMIDDPSVISQNGAVAEDVSAGTGFFQVLAIAVPIVAVLALVVVLIRRKK